MRYEVICVKPQFYALMARRMGVTSFLTLCILDNFLKRFDSLIANRFKKNYAKCPVHEQILARALNYPLSRLFITCNHGECYLINQVYGCF